MRLQERSFKMQKESMFHDSIDKACPLHKSSTRVKLERSLIEYNATKHPGVHDLR